MTEEFDPLKSEKSRTIHTKTEQEGKPVAIEIEAKPGKSKVSEEYVDGVLHRDGKKVWYEDTKGVSYYTKNGHLYNADDEEVVDEDGKRRTAGHFAREGNPLRTPEKIEKLAREAKAKKARERKEKNTAKPKGKKA